MLKRDKRLENQNIEIRNPKQYQNQNVQILKQKRSCSVIFVLVINIFVISICFVLRYSNFGFFILLSPDYFNIISHASLAVLSAAPGVPSLSLIFARSCFV